MTLEEALAEIQRVSTHPAVLRLCLDCWEFGKKHGEEAGLSFARMLLEGVKVYNAHEREVKRLSSWGARETSLVPFAPVPLGIQEIGTAEG